MVYHATEKKYRLITRSDFDGLVCAILLKELDMLGDIKFVNPKDVQDGKIEVNENDILTNLPYAPGCFLCFDHHSSEQLRNSGIQDDRYVLRADADSAARVVFDYFGGAERFLGISEEMMTAVDKADSARFEREDVLNPTGWDLMSFLLDARTGLGRFRTFRVSNYKLMMDLIDYCKDHTIDEILALPDVKERVDLYFEHTELMVEQIRRCSVVHYNLVVLDLQGEETIYCGNRFMIYALFPQCNISMHVLSGLQRQNTVFTVGKSIFNRSSDPMIEELMLQYGGGGHANAGTCQVSNEDAERVQHELIDQITRSAVTV